MADVNATTFINNLTNFTTTTEYSRDRDTELDATVRQGFNIFLIVGVSLIMLGLGCVVEVSVLKHHALRPVGVITGLLVQFVAFPAITFGLAHAFKLEQLYAFGMILLGTCPGGSISNVLTYYMEGEVTLSVCMTTFSTVIGIGMMPLNAWIYSRSWVDSTITVPYQNIMTALATMVIPVAIGMIILRKWPTVAKWMTRIGSVIGMLVVIGVIGTNVFLYPEIFTESWELWLAAFLLPALGLSVGYAVTSIFCLPHACRRAVAVENGCQNVALCMGILSLSYKGEVLLKAMAFPELFLICSTTIILVLIAIYHIQKQVRKRLGLVDDVQEKNKKDVAKIDEPEIQVVRF